MTPTPPRQSQPLQRALSALAEGQLGHALLITGAERSGQYELARTLAKRLLCTTVQGASRACGQCRGCQQAEAGSHADLRILTLELNDKTDKLRTEITVEQVRQLSEWLVFTPQQG